MGQAKSLVGQPMPATIQQIQSKVLRQARQITEVATCSYDEFQRCLRELNSLSSQITSKDGKQLFFAIKKGSDQTLLWRGTVRIAVIQMDYHTSQIESKRCLTLSQFLRIFSTIQGQLVSALRHSCMEKDPSADCGKSVCHCLSNVDLLKGDLGVDAKLTYSMILNDLDHLTGEPTDKITECCICLERNPDVMLPCAHAYCSPCIEEWSSCKNTCPICRESINSTHDAWVISDIPVSEDICQEIRSVLMDVSSQSSSSNN